MRNLIISLILALSPIVLNAGVDEYKTDVYFANGIQTEDWEARKNTRDVLKPAIIDKFGIEYYNNYIGKVDYAYNHTDGLVLDLWESLAQKLNFQELIDAIFDTSHERDLGKQVKAYKDSIEDGHKVLVVAHSQGNLFTAEALDALQDWMQDYFYAVSVASPRAFKIKSDTPHIAFDNDIVPWLGGVYVAIDNPNDEVGSIETHAFTYYMGLPSAESNKTTNVAKIKIMKAIQNGINTLDKLPSQWIKDTQKGARKEHLVKVKHRYDSDNLIISEDVYPFNSAKKLYQVDGEYVKASFGGTKILDADYDTWADKKDNEFYYLEGTGEIISEDDSNVTVIRPQNDRTYSLATCNSNPSSFLYLKGKVSGENEKFVKIIVDNKAIYYRPVSDLRFWRMLPITNQELDIAQNHTIQVYSTDKDKSVISKSTNVSFSVKVYKTRCGRAMW